MKRLIITILLTASTFGAYAQTYYYEQGRTIQGSDYQYKCTNELDYVEIYATTTWQAETLYTFANGDYIYNPTKNRPVISPENSYELMRGLCSETFSTQEKQRIKGGYVDVTLYFDFLGNVTGVMFSFYGYISGGGRNGFCTIPPETFRKLENKIKEKVKYTITEEGRNRNYNKGFFEYRPK